MNEGNIEKKPIITDRDLEKKGYKPTGESANPKADIYKNKDGTISVHLDKETNEAILGMKKLPDGTIEIVKPEDL